MAAGTSTKDEKTELQNQGALFLYARELDILMSDAEQYWRWFSVREKSESFDVAELLNVMRFQVRGSFDCKKLAPDTKYEVLFLMKMMSTSSGWVRPVRAELTLPSGQMTACEKKFEDIPPTKDKWFEWKIGEFLTPNRPAGIVELSLRSYSFLWRKRGLLVKGVLVRPATGSGS